MDVGEGREQAVPARPALTAFVHPCTAERKLRALISAFLQVFLRGKGYLSMVYIGYRDCPSPEPPSHELVQRLLASISL